MIALRRIARVVPVTSGVRRVHVIVFAHFLAVILIDDSKLAVELLDDRVSRRELLWFTCIVEPVLVTGLVGKDALAALVEKSFDRGQIRESWYLSSEERNRLQDTRIRLILCVVSKIPIDF